MFGAGAVDRLPVGALNPDGRQPYVHRDSREDIERNNRNSVFSIADIMGADLSPSQVTNVNIGVRRPFDELNQRAQQRFISVRQDLTQCFSSFLASSSGLSPSSFEPSSSSANYENVLKTNFANSQSYPERRAVVSVAAAAGKSNKQLKAMFNAGSRICADARRLHTSRIFASVIPAKTTRISTSSEQFRDLLQFLLGLGG